MLHEHELGRAHVAAVAAALDGAGRGEPGALAALREHLSGYIALLRAHIDKEDHILYPMADRLLDAADQEGCWRISRAWSARRSAPASTRNITAWPKSWWGKPRHRLKKDAADLHWPV